MNAIKVGNIAECKRQIQTLLDEICQSMTTIPEYQVSVAEIYMAIVNTAGEMGFNWIAHTGGKPWSLEAVLACKEIDETQAILEAMCKQLVEGIASNHVENGKRISREAIAYLKEHYRGPEHDAGKNLQPPAHQHRLFQHGLSKRKPKKHSINT